MITNIPLNCLHASEDNVRTFRPDTAADKALIASIEAHGVLENLIVRPHAAIDNAFEVTAGGRRLEALKHLQEVAKLPEDHPVPCLISEHDNAREISLTENMIRAAMHPADEYVAFAKMVDDGLKVSEIALHFGTDETTVKQRLSLGNLAPELLDALRADEIDLARLKALTLTDDHELQISLFERYKECSWNYHPSDIRRIITESAIASNSRLGAFATVDAYTQAGGAVTKDLFDADCVFMEDPDLVHRLVDERLLEEKNKLLKAGWLWVETVHDIDHSALNELGRMQSEYIDVPSELSDELDAIKARQAELEDMDDALWSDELDEEDSELWKRERELQTMRSDYLGYTQESKAQSGCFVAVGHHGKANIVEGIVRKEDMKAKSSSNAAGDETANDGGEKPFTLANAHAQDLIAHRLLIAKSYLATDFDLSFDLMVFTLCLKTFNPGYFFTSTPLDASLNSTECRSSRNDIEGSPADVRLTAIQSGLDLAFLNEEDKAKSFDILSAKPAAEKQRLFAICVALSLYGSLDIDNTGSVFETVGKRLKIDIADDWRPTKDSFWGRINKARCLEFAGEILGEEWVQAHSKDKKAALVTRLTSIFSGEDAASFPAHVRDAALRWVPDFMRFGSRALPEPEPVDTDDASEPSDHGSHEVSNSDEDVASESAVVPPEDNEVSGQPSGDRIQILHVGSKPSATDGKPEEQVEDVTDDILPAFLRDAG